MKYMNIFASDSAGPFFRFVMEISSWIWIFVVFRFYAIIAVLALALFNVPGDKKPEEDGVLGIPIPGKLRVTFELVTAFIGIFSALIFLGLIGGFLQLLITIAYVSTDKDRLSWLWGYRTYPPESVTNLYKYRKDKST